jgi:predicted nucleic acid-binding protein
LRQYFDTSVIVSFVVHEVHTPLAREWLRRDETGENIISEWTLTEFHSALSLKLRTNQISAEIKKEAEVFFKRAQNALFKTIPVVSIDFARAAELAARPELWLRAGDALHLAIAERLEAKLCAFDKKLFAAAERVGVVAQMP